MTKLSVQTHSETNKRTRKHTGTHASTQVHTQAHRYTRKHTGTHILTSTHHALCKSHVSVRCVDETIRRLSFRHYLSVSDGATATGSVHLHRTVSTLPPHDSSHNAADELRAVIKRTKLSEVELGRCLRLN